MSETTDTPFVVTLKGGKGYESPWIVVRGDSADEIAENLQALATSDIYQAVSDAASLFTGTTVVATAPAASGEPAQERQAETSAPARQRGAAPSGGGSSYGRKKSVAGTGGRGGQKPRMSYEEASADCSHGERVRRAGNGAKGAWVGYFCPTPKGDPNQCSPNFLNPEDDQEG